MKFSRFVHHLAQLEVTNSRLAMTNLLAQVWHEADPAEIELLAYLLQGVLVPNYLALEFQLSTKMVLRALEKLTTQQSETQMADLFGQVAVSPTTTLQVSITTAYKALGDVGLVVESHLSKLPPQPQQSVEVAQVYRQLFTIAQVGGSGSQDAKLELLVRLLRQVSPLEGKFIARIIVGKLRLGFSTMTLIDSLSWVRWGDKRDSEILELAYQQKADIGKLAVSYLTTDFTPQTYQVEVGVPLVPALCQRLNSAAEIIEKMPVVYAEPKYDGLRIQIHIDKSGIIERDLLGQPTGKVVLYKAFTRNLEDVSQMFPELAQIVEQVACQSCILDSEAVGVNPQNGTILPFQQTITRKRKHEISETAQAVPLRFFTFDVMAHDGVGVIDQPLVARKKILQTILQKAGPAVITSAVEITNPQKLKEFHEQQLANGLEGAVMKQINSEYRSGRKGWRWVKIKEHEGTSGKLNDTVDCVVMGYYTGKGKRTQFGVGAFLLGVVAVVEGEYQVKTLAKLGTGLTDTDFPLIKELVDAYKTPTMPPNYTVDKGLIPDVWIEPAVVLEIAADEITQSPTHSAGVSLRFPRLVRVRSDKSWEQATDTQQLESIAIAT